MGLGLSDVKGVTTVRGMVDLNENRCKGCELCVSACPKDVLAMGTHINALGYRPATVVQADKCTACQACAIVCPEVAFNIFRVA